MEVLHLDPEDLKQNKSNRGKTSPIPFKNLKQNDCLHSKTRSKHKQSEFIICTLVQSEFIICTLVQSEFIIFTPNHFSAVVQEHPNFAGWTFSSHLSEPSVRTSWVCGMKTLPGQPGARPGRSELEEWKLRTVKREDRVQVQNYHVV